MTRTVINFIVLFVVLAMAQAIVFNHICLFGVAIPLVFIYLIVKLPVTLNLNWSMTIAFLLGLTIDILSDTQGANALACTILATIRKPVLHLYVSREDEMTDPEPTNRSLGLGVYAKYLLSICLIYCTLYFLIEAFTFFNLGRLLLKILSSTLLTFVIILAIDLLTSRRREKRL